VIFSSFSKQLSSICNSPIFIRKAAAKAAASCYIEIFYTIPTL
jgi:hypothetical protein